MKKEESLHILIADDHGVVRYGVMLLIKELYPTAILHQAATFNEALKTIRNQHVDLLILDINIAGGNNVQMLHVVKVLQEDLKVLMFSAYSEELYALRYIQAEANGYLHKDSTEQEIKKAITVVLSGKTYVSEAIKDSLINTVFGGSVFANNLDTLSNRELEVARLLAEGSGVSEISATLNLHISTISTYKIRVFEKLGIKNIAELIRAFDGCKKATIN